MANAVFHLRNGFIGPGTHSLGSIK